MNDINAIKNVLSIAKEVLKFYARSNNYVPQENNNNLIPILLDGGHQANYALETIDHITELLNKNYEEYYNQTLKQENQSSIDEIKKIIEDIKNIQNEQD